MVRSILATLIIGSCVALCNPTHYISKEDVVYTTPPLRIANVIEEQSDYEVLPTKITRIKAMVTTSEEELMSKEDIELIALVTQAEAEGESEQGKRLVIDTILNRMDSELSYFPDTVREVIYQKNAFTSVWNGRMDKCEVVDDICDLVREELVSRTNSEVMYFTAGKYGKYGTPMFAVGNHYFSSN